MTTDKEPRKGISAALTYGSGKNPGDKHADILLVHEKNNLGIGAMSRYVFQVDNRKLREEGCDCRELFLRIKNMESPLLRPVYLTGPYSFYVDIRPCNYDEDKQFTGAEDIDFCSDLKPDEKFKARLYLNANSRLQTGDPKDEIYSWTIDIISQLAVVTFPILKYSLKIGTSKKSVKKTRGRKVTPVMGILLKMWDEKSLWNLPPKYIEKPVHLVIITHGIFSNVGCDMLFMKDKIEQTAFAIDEEYNPNIVIRGCMENMGKSAHGIYYLGKRIAKYVMDTVDELNKEYKVDKISFIGHSLGGPTQAMAVHYISMMRPDFFNPQTGVKPVHFIALASPFIGVIGDFPLYLSVPLDMGALGLTGRDLNLKYTPLTSNEGLSGLSLQQESTNLPRNILEIIPQPPAQQVFQMFQNRTVYANIVHDGIVPLRTAALLYLDWRSLNEVKDIRKSAGETNSNKVSEDTPSDAENSGSSNDKMGEIPAESPNHKNFLQWALPQVIVRGPKMNKFKRGQVMGGKGSDSSDTDTESTASNQEEKFKGPAEASTFMSALSTLTAPVPNQQYIKDPSIRKDRIVHDRLYEPEDLPEPHYIKRSTMKRIVYPNESINRIQERIARAWQLNMSWRKVLVEIKPDSHNNIVVRRRFVNLYGNVAIAHMVKEHFGLEACKNLSKLSS
ncbi:hypothetical protein RNJ44_03162 [Nakaseomyces bracarensis]|uniref:DUF676 domain-containing protein n=1 Tax=Nakaseomyces bracarensis TaxID=273131 RepID=A0ABR4NYZ7_9SACH